MQWLSIGSLVGWWMVARAVLPLPAVPQEAVSPAAAFEIVEEGGTLRFSFPPGDGVPALELLRAVAERTGTDYVFSREDLVHVVLHGAGEVRVRPERLRSTAESLLAVYGLRFHRLRSESGRDIVVVTRGAPGRTSFAGGAYVPARLVDPDQLDALADEPGTLVRVALPLEHADPERMLVAIGQTLRSSPAVQLATDPGSRTLLLTAPAPVAAQARRLLRALDRPEAADGEGARARVALRHAAAREAAAMVTQLFSEVSQGEVHPSPELRAVADERTNAVLLYGSRAAVERARGMLDAIDVPDRAEKDDALRIVRADRSRIPQLVDVLRRLVQRERDVVVAGYADTGAVVIQGPRATVERLVSVAEDLTSGDD